jgi:predicted ATP-grasp superfamily ATP-dependent carboligase
MDALQWEHRPTLREPVMVVAFSGWTDAGSAATGAASHLAEQWHARRFASIDAEDFYDFTVLRPHVRLRSDQSRRIIWPENRFLAAGMPGGRDIIILIGIEPHLRWRSFASCVTEVAQSMSVQSVVVLGAMLSEVPHTRATPVRGSTVSPKLAERFGLSRPQYQGPTGIVGVLTATCADAGVDVASLMAQVPHYVSNVPSPKATLALVKRVGELLEAPVDTSELQSAASAYESEVNGIVEADDDIVRYVRQLEEQDEDLERPEGLGDLPSRDELAEELERFLREQGPQ